MPIQEGGKFTPDNNIVSPGVFTRELDQSGVAAGIAGSGGDEARRVTQLRRDLVGFVGTAVHQDDGLSLLDQAGYVLANGVQVHARRPAHFNHNHLYAP